ncbi:hypothetical protein FB561_5986 [Kribbella amoyensis]|uniref:Uncharacterized protein n=1 Tax=Kribbella amoyensis TaxID=996641 RepID=A0A561C164_9ACTN|nr:DUF6069 family protein [Kribbella amoyensis]TWD84790.1 hypothetical protein FB561_5986 [Kribbella amoyensis]
MSTVEQNTRTSNPHRVPGRSRLAVVGATAVAAEALWVVLTQVAGIDLKAQQGGTIEVGAVSVGFASLAMAFLGWGLLALLERRGKRNPRDTWTVVAAIVCTTSLGSPLNSGIGAGSKLGLAALHVIVGAVVILGLRRTSSPVRCD